MKKPLIFFKHPLHLPMIGLIGLTLVYGIIQGTPLLSLSFGQELEKGDFSPVVQQEESFPAQPIASSSFFPTERPFLWSTGGHWGAGTGQDRPVRFFTSPIFADRSLMSPNSRAQTSDRFPRETQNLFFEQNVLSLNSILWNSEADFPDASELNLSLPLPVIPSIVPLSDSPTNLSTVPQTDLLSDLPTASLTERTEEFGQSSPLNIPTFPSTGRTAAALVSEAALWAGTSSGNEPVLRGNLSELAIDPYNKRVTGYVTGEWAKQEKQGDSELLSGFETEVFGGGLGQDYLIGKYVVGGFWLNGLTQKLNVNSDHYSGKVDSFSGRVHLGIFGKMWYTDVAVGVGKNWNTHRMFLTGSPLFQDNLFENKFTGTQWNYEGEFGLKLYKGHTCISPFARLRILNLNEPGTAGIFPDTSIYIPMSYSRMSSRLMLGSRLSWEYSTYLADISPSMQGMWVHEFSDTDVFTTGDLTPFPVAYRFGQYTQARDRFVLGAGLTIALKETLDLYAYYNGTFANDYTNTTLWGGFNKKF